jgi:hypothetical protein
MTESKITVEQLAKTALDAALDSDYLPLSLQLRALTQEFLRQNPQLSEINRPNTNDLRALAAAASLIELFALRSGQQPPAWTTEIRPLPEKMYLINAAAIGSFTRWLCDTESPEPLRKRGFLAPPNFLEFH